jgi:hypothetical protein
MISSSRNAEDTMSLHSTDPRREPTIHLTSDLDGINNVKPQAEINQAVLSVFERLISA